MHEIYLCLSKPSYQVQKPSRISGGSKNACMSQKNNQQQYTIHYNVIYYTEPPSTSLVFQILPHNPLVSKSYSSDHRNMCQGIYQDIGLKRHQEIERSIPQEMTYDFSLIKHPIVRASTQFHTLLLNHLSLSLLNFIIFYENI